MLILLGANHRSAPIDIRERLAVPEDVLPGALTRLLARDGIEEGMILSTCNRLEVLCYSSSATHDDGIRSVKQFLAEECGMSAKELDRYSYQLVSRETVRHIFRVGAGLDSMIVGEPQILGQLKQAYAAAQKHESTGPILDRLLQQGLSAAKRARSETGITRSAVTVGFAAVELARTIFGALSGRRALLLGAGKMSGLVAKHLSTRGVAEIVVASRSYNRAVALAEQVGGRAVHWDDGFAELSQTDIVVSCTGAPRQILSKEQVAGALRSRRGQPLFIMDIAVPRDVDPRVDKLENVYLYDIDALQNVVDSNIEQRKQAAVKAGDIINSEVDAFERWRQSREVTPLIVALRERLFEVSRGEMDRFRPRLGPLTPNQEKAVEELTRALVQKVLHRPIRHLRGAVDRGDVDSCRALFADLFDLGDSVRDGEASERPAAADDDRPGPRGIVRGGKEE